MAKQEPKTVPSYNPTGYNFGRDDSGKFNTKDGKIKSLQYPATGLGDHYVRFFINLDEESRLITQQQVEVLGNVDQTDQNRIRRNPMSQDDFQAGVTVAAAVGGLAAGASIDPTSKLGKKIRGFKGLSSQTAARVVPGLVTGIGAAGIAYALSSQIKIDKALKRLAANITLYTPPSVTNSQRVGWGETDDVIFELMQLKAENETADIIKQSAGVASAMGRIVATAASDLVQGATRTAVNKRKDLLFKHIDRREFIFDYSFAPKNAIEADMVANIIYLFRLFQAPELIDGAGAFLYNYPAEFDIEYGYRGDGSDGQNKYINKISSCVLKNVTINYTPNGSFQTLERGEPVQINMTLHFEELETLHRDRIAKGY